jgi:hypothetical protein
MAFEALSRSAPICSFVFDAHPIALFVSLPPIQLAARSPVRPFARSLALLVCAGFTSHIHSIVSADWLVCSIGAAVRRPAFVYPPFDRALCEIHIYLTHR